MPTDSQAVTRLQEDRLAAIERLQKVQERLTEAQNSVTSLTNTEVIVQDEIDDIDAAIAAAIALP